MQFYFQEDKKIEILMYLNAMFLLILFSFTYFQGGTKIIFALGVTGPEVIPSCIHI